MIARTLPPLCMFPATSAKSINMHTTVESTTISIRPALHRECDAQGFEVFSLSLSSEVWWRGVRVAGENEPDLHSSATKGVLRAWRGSKLEVNLCECVSNA